MNGEQLIWSGLPSILKDCYGLQNIQLRFMLKGISLLLFSGNKYLSPIACYYHPNINYAQRHVFLNIL